MINSIHLKNFQSHKDTIMTFTNGVNVIVGPSDVGKTSLIRALRWLVHNRPSGEEFISHGETSTSVRIEFDNTIIARVKTKGISKNSYVLNGIDLVGFGQDVPEEVSSLINMNDINIQYQLDGPFLLGESSGVVAKTLNKIVNLDKIDSSLTNVKRLETHNKQSLEKALNRFQTLTEELGNSPDFSRIDRLFDEVTVNYQASETHKAVLAELTSLLKALDYCQQTLDNIVVPDIDFLQVEKDLVELKNKSKLLVELGELLKSIRVQTERLKNYEETVEQCNQELKLLCPDLCPLCGQPVTPTLLFGASTVDVDVQKENGGKSTVKNGAVSRHEPKR